MAQLLMIREQLKLIIGKYEQYAKPAAKFLLALIALIFVNSALGYATQLSHPAIVLIVALLCSFLPMNFIVIFSAAFALLHLYALSLESVVVVGAVMLIMFLLYFRFAPKDTILLVFTPICFVLNIPYVMPLCAGLVGSVASIVSIACGTILYYIIAYITANANLISGQETENFLTNLRIFIDAIIYNKEMMVVIAAFSVTIIVVNFIRKLSVDYAWPIAIITGTLFDIVLILVGDLKYNTYISIAGLLLGSLLAIFVAVVIQFFVFNVDYSRTERVQFEDDEYYYYVKAVPKNTVAIPEKHIKKVRGQAKPTKKSGTGGTSSKASSVARDKDISEYRVRRSATTGYDSQGIGNKNGTKRIILPEEDLADIPYIPTSARNARVDRNGLTDIERAAAQKARENRARNASESEQFSNHDFLDDFLDE